MEWAVYALVTFSIIGLSRVYINHRIDECAKNNDCEL